MPAKYHHILIAGSGPQLEIRNVGVGCDEAQDCHGTSLERCSKEKYHKRKSLENKRHMRTLKKTSRSSQCKIKHVQHLFSLPDWHRGGAARKHSAAVLQDKSARVTDTTSLPPPICHSQGGFLPAL